MAWITKTTDPKSFRVGPKNGGILPPRGSVEVNFILGAMSEEPPFDAVCRDKMLFQAVYVEPDDDHKDWRKLINMPGRDRWERKVRMQFSPPLDPH